mgnify:CR=1 FL=1|jgi:hypothetical protein
MKKIIHLIVVVAFCSCSAPKGLYTWNKYEKASYNYLKKADEKSAETIIVEYNNVINKQKGTRKTTPPGMLADYGFLLIQQGQMEEGKLNLKREMALYPESKIFIDRILNLLEQ